MQPLRLALSLLFASLLSWHSLAEPFVFTAIPDEDETRLKARFDRVAVYLAERLKVEVEYIPVKSYPAAVSAFRNDQVQLAWFGGLTGVQARRLVPGAQVIAQGAEDPRFKSYLIAHVSTGLEPAETLPDAIRGMTLTFGSKSSTSGRLMPEYYLRQRFGEAPETLFSRVGFSDNHSRTIALVQAGAYQLGTLNYAVWDEELAQGNIDPDKVRVIWTTPPYPDYQWTLRGDVDARWGAGFAARVRQALLDMDDPELLAAFPRSAFIPASNADFEAIAETARAIGLMDE
ncbi:MAG TPA: putative selenate ABC transporter substrate-binding protein [Spongiibacteraceae bacterium]|nr:putative selenate ABC transporter substrate-binding protein [Spongiibacteraceae bacterium]